MKAQIFKSIAVVAISGLTLSISAQNTKSVNFDKHSSSRLFASVENSDNIISSVNKEIKIQLSKMEALSKLFPRMTNVFYAEPRFSDSWATIASELEDVVRFKPEESFVKKADDMMALEEATKELEQQVKFNPNESIVNEDYAASNEFTEVLTALEKDVKYHPTKLDDNTSVK